MKKRTRRETLQLYQHAILLPASSCVSARSPLPPACFLQKLRRRQWVASPRQSATALCPIAGWGQVPQRPDPATKCRVPRDHPLCRCNRSAAHPVGSFLMGEALAGAPLLVCPFAESFRCIRVVASAVFTAGSAWHVLLRFSPLPGRSARSGPYPSRPCDMTGRTGLCIRVCAGPRPDFRTVWMWTPAYPDRHRRFQSTWVGSTVGSVAFSRKLLKWGKKRKAGEVFGRQESMHKVMSVSFQFFLLVSDCNVNG